MSTERNASALARALGRHRNTVAEYRRAGCPADLPGAVAWLEARAAEKAKAPLEARIGELEAALAAAGDTTGVSEGEARRRKRLAEALLLELQLARERGEVVPASDMDVALIAITTATSARLRGVPAKVALELAAESNAAACHGILEREIHRALHDLADAGQRAVERAEAMERAGTEGDAA